MNRFSLSLSFLSILGVAGVAFGGEQEPSPPIWFDDSFRIVGCTNKESDSSCIGDPKTPLCAVETWLAARLRDDEDLLAIARGQRPGPAKEFSTLSSCIMKEGYKVLTIRRYVTWNIPRGGKIKPWDVGMYMQLANCTYGKCEVGLPNDDRSFLIRKGQYGWHVVFSDNWIDFSNLN